MNLILKSIKLDFAFFRLRLPLREKCAFVWQKYLNLFKNFIFGVKLGVSHAEVFGAKYFFDEKLGITILEMMYVDDSYLKKIIPPRSVIIDIGANIGQFNFFCRHYLNAKKIYSFEPVEASYNILKLNTKANIFNYAIQAKKKLIFYVPPVSSYASAFPAEDSRTETVNGIKLDSIEEIKKVKQIDLLKIDVEGGEYEVLQASQATLRKSKFILIEINVERGSSVPCRFLETLQLLKALSPSIELVKMSRVYRNRQNEIIAVDFLFQNQAFVS